MSRPLPRARHVAASAAFLAAVSSATFAADLTLNGATTVNLVGGNTLDFELTGTPEHGVLLLLDTSPGPEILLGEVVPLGLTPNTILLKVGATDTAGDYSTSVNTPTDLDVTVYIAALLVDPTPPNPIEATNNVELNLSSIATASDYPLAGNSLGTYPDFEFVTAFNMGSSVEVGIDPARIAGVANGETVDIYVTTAKSAAQWDADPTLIDVSGDGFDTVLLSDVDLASNRFVVDPGTLNGIDAAELGVGYDVVVDRDQNGSFDGSDLIDGYGDEPGLFVVRDVTQPGPYSVVEATYSGGSFLGQNLFYPTNIAALGPRPLVVVSHGNGHNYQWYDHLGNHLASYGFVVMSHQNNTVPGIETASTTTLTNTDFLLGNLDTIQGGVLDGLVAVNQMIWIGHSRGGEGVARAYDRIFDGNWTPVNYTLADIRLVSSIAPTDFLGTNSSTPHDANYHLWVGGADADVTGCASNDIAQSFHLLDRAENQRQSISLHGVGHGDFHDGGGSSVASGPCLVGRAATHDIMRGYVLPLFRYHLVGHPAAKDFLTRQWESFRPVGAPTSGCVTVDLTFHEGAETGKLVIDDFQTNPSLSLASSGAAISTSMLPTFEGRLDDGTSNFNNDSDRFNGFTFAAASDSTSGMVAVWSADASLSYTLLPGDRDWSGFDCISFRAAQATRRTATQAVLGDLVFEVRIADAGGNSSTISIGAYGGGIEEPYQRGGCGSGVGWGNEMETIRLPLANYLTGGTNVDLTDIETLEFLFGPSHGDAQGIIGIDDIELTVD